MDIVASILGGLVSGLFTFLGVLITILYQRKKDKADLAEKEREERVLRFKERPRLEIVEYSGEKLYEEEQDVDLGFIVCSIRKFQNEGRPCFFVPEHFRSDHLFFAWKSDSRQKSKKMDARKPNGASQRADPFADCLLLSLY